MADFSKITERLYCGAAIHSISDLTQIETSGITHIVDAQVEHNDASLLIAGHWPLERYLYDATADDGVHPKPVGYKVEHVEVQICGQRGTERFS